MYLGLVLIEMKVFIKTAGYTLFYHKRNEEILEQMNVEPADENLRRHKSDWLWYGTRMNNSWWKVMLKCRPNGWRQLGRPVNSLSDRAQTGVLRQIITIFHWHLVPQDSTTLTLYAFFLLVPNPISLTKHVSFYQNCPVPMQLQNV